MPSFRLQYPLAALILAAASGCRDAHGTDDSFPRNQTLYVGGYQWAQPSTFNPLASTPDWPVTSGNAHNLFYETLLVFNTLTGEMQPLLAESFAVKPGSVEVLLQPTARFSDGSPVTAEDVKYTFELGRDNRSLRWAPVWAFLTEIVVGKRDPAAATPAAINADSAAEDERRVTFVLNPERVNPLVVLDSLQETYILPRHVIEPLFIASGNDVNEFLRRKFDQGSVGSGPYNLLSYSAEKIATIRRDEYWGNDVFFGGKKAVPKYVVHPVYKSNDHYSVALQQGRLDASSSFIPRIWLKQRKGVRAWYDKVPYFMPGAMPVLWINHLRPPLGDVHLRRAMAFAIQYDDIRELAVSGYSEPLKPGLIMPMGFEGAYYSDEDAQKYGAAYYDPKRAQAELESGGYQPVWSANGELLETRDRSGRRIPTITIKAPTGWTDWESSVRIVVRSLRAAGIDARERFIDAGVYYPATLAGDFDLIMATPSPAPTPSKPWSRFDFVLSNRDFAPIGDKMYKNLGRFNDRKSPGYIPRFDELLDLIPTLTDQPARLAAYRELNALFMQQQPVLTLVYRPDQFYEFSNRVWQGFPTAANPFLPPQIPTARLGTRTLWHLTLTEAAAP
jgi:peptide/nickel transport system substrate-binding protein